jgi:hypothetical protein
MMPEPSILDARLAEIDRRLRTIQSGLAPGAEAPPTPPSASFPSPTLVPPPPPDVVSRGPDDAEMASRGPDGAEVARHSQADRELAVRLRELIDDHERLLAAARALLASYERSAPPGSAVPSPSLAPDPADTADTAVSVAAGPFVSTEALRRFERALATLSEVRDVVVREYVGEDRAVVDVHLFTPTS